MKMTMLGASYTFIYIHIPISDVNRDRIPSPSTGKERAKRANRWAYSLIALSAAADLGIKMGKCLTTVFSSDRGSDIVIYSAAAGIDSDVGL